MIFEVWKDGECLMGTAYASCIYPERILKSMQSEGYKFKLNGKSISLKNLMEALKEDENYERV